MSDAVRTGEPVFISSREELDARYPTLAIGLDPTGSLVISQVVLSFGIPFALVPLVILTRKREVMGALVNRRATTVAASVVAGLIICLNVFLLAQTFGVA